MGFIKSACLVTGALLLGVGIRKLTTCDPKPVVEEKPPLVEDHIPTPNNSYDFAKSLGLEAGYLRELKFDSNAKEFITSLSTLPEYMEDMAVHSGLMEELLNDKLIDAKELRDFDKVIGSYQKEIETMQPWLNQVSEKESLEALALNLSNFMEADETGELFNSLGVEQVPTLLSTGIFFADGKERKYEEEILRPEAFQRGETAINPYSSATTKNITNFLDIHNKAWEVANSPDAKYHGESIDEILRPGYFEGEAVGSTDKGQNAYEDIKLLLGSGSPAAKATLRLYARNMTREGRQGSAPQVRVPLTMVDAWSVGIDSIAVVIAGHDVPGISITDDDIALLKQR